ncbi:MAG: PAS domain-containing protein [Ramlibacter sp.]|nr:PAS domain-containing protein [Ramlibacter sp.]
MNTRDRYMHHPAGAERSTPAAAVVADERKLSAKVLQAIGDSVLAQLAVLDSNGVVIETNAAWRAFAQDTVMATGDALPRSRPGANYLDCVAACNASTAAASRDAIADVIAGRSQLYTLEYGCCLGGEAERWYVMNVTPLKIEGGGAVVAHTDVTELKRTAGQLQALREQLEQLVDQRTRQLERSNAALSESERFVHAITDNLPAGLAYWGSDFRCRFANRNYRDRFGLGDKDVVSLEMRTLLGPELTDRLRPAFDKVLSGQRHEYTTSYPGDGGRRNHYLVTLIPDLHDGVVAGVFVIASDVTDLKEAELEMRRANCELTAARDRAEAASRAKSTFLANMSHEIRTPINAIIGFTDILRHEIQDDAQARRLAHVANAASNLSELLGDILDLSKVEAGKLALEIRDFSLAGVLQHAALLVEEQARIKGLIMTTRVVNVPDLLCGDATRVSQALTNLMGNAVKFTETGSVDVTVSQVETGDDDMVLRFDVRDTGIGIAPGTVGKLFAAFEQADSSSTRRFGGTGLGLALTQRLAELMGGTAGVTSTLGEGSHFWFTARLARGTGLPGH